MRVPVALLLVLTVPAVALATLYSYIDDQGVRHYTNVPADSRAVPVRPGQHWVRPRARLTVGKLMIKGRSSCPPRSLSVTDKKAPATAFDLEATIRRICNEHRVDPLLIKAIIKTESNFNRFAVSPHGAKGLMQLMPETARDLQVSDPFDPYQNIYGGTRYFRQLLDTYRGDLQLSLAAYNAGPGRVSRHGSLPRIPETVQYVRKVLRHYRAYQMNGEPATRINLRQLVTVN